MATINTPLAPKPTPLILRLPKAKAEQDHQKSDQEFGPTKEEFDSDQIVCAVHFIPSCDVKISG